MVLFNLWGEGFIFASIYAVIIIIPCVLMALLGRKMINELGRRPSQAPIIHMSIFVQLCIIEIVTFTCLIAFYHVFSD